MSKLLKYFFIGIIFWFVIDFTTTKAIRNPGLYYSTYMPTLLIFYIGYPLIFAFLIYKFNFINKKLFIATLIGAFIVEVLFVHNPLLITFPLMLVGIPAAVSIYSLITYVPKWMVDGEIKNNKWKLFIMVTVYVLISLASLLGGGSGP